MPEISAFCPGCGRAVKPGEEEDPALGASLRDSLLGALTYVLILPAVVFLLVPPFKKSRFIRFHSWQSIFFLLISGLAALLTRLLFFVFSVIPVIGYLFAWLLIGLVALAVVVLWGVLVIKAALGDAFELPWIGPLAAHLASEESFR